MRPSLQDALALLTTLNSHTSSCPVCQTRGAGLRPRSCERTAPVEVEMQSDPIISPALLRRPGQALVVRRQQCQLIFTAAHGERTVFSRDLSLQQDHWWVGRGGAR